VSVINAIFDRMTENRTRNTRSLVSEPGRFRRVIVFAMAGMVITIAAAFLGILNAGPVGNVSVAVLIFLSLHGAYSGVHQAVSYRQGWLEGRQAMAASYREAHLRGMSVEDWVEGELERDTSLIFGDVRFPRRHHDD
jgi:hypothetical protein